MAALEARLRGRKTESEEQVVALFAGTKGFLDDLPVADVKRFENDLLDYVRARHGDFLAGVDATARDAPEADHRNNFV